MDSIADLRGPEIYQNWMRMREGGEPGPVLEYPLYSDAQLVRRWTSSTSPYEFVGVLRETPDVPRTVAAVVRLSYYRNPAPLFVREQPGPYHGGEMQDELAALISLEFGVRLKASKSYSRRWGFETDSKGQPVSHEEPVVVPVSSHPLLPRHGGFRKFDEIRLLPRLPLLGPDDAAILVVAARLYQEAVWIADADAEYAWLLLVSAVETAANRWQTAAVPPRDRMRTSRPELESVLLEAGGDKLADRVAGMVADYMGATRKFRDFLLHFMPPAPTDRCAEEYRIDWSPEYLKKAFERIYGYRSRKLHGGTSIPFPLCQAPITIEERPVGHSVSSAGQNWMFSEVPMLLHVFDFITRNALLAWWRSMPEVQTAP